MVSISTLGQTLDQISRISSSQIQLDDLSRQIATGRRADSFAGFESDVVNLQRLRADVSEIDGYLSNISILEPRVEITQNIIEESIAQVEGVRDALTLRLQETSEFDITSINEFATEALSLIQDFVNTELNGRFLLAGDDVTNQPYDNPSLLQSEIAGRIPGFLDGSTTPGDFLNSIATLTDTQLGYSATVQSSDNVFSRIDRGIEIDYTARANSDAFRDVIGALGALSQLSFPTEGVDLATEGDFFEVYNGLADQLTDGLNGLRSEFNALERDRVVIDDTKQKLEAELGLFLSESEGLENVDPAESIVNFQSLQTQLEASFQVTSIIAQTSLINFI